MKRRAWSSMVGGLVALGVAVVACHGGAVGVTVPHVDGGTSTEGGTSAEGGGQPKGICSANCPSSCSVNKDCPQNICQQLWLVRERVRDGARLLFERCGLSVPRHMLPNESSVQAERVRRDLGLLPALLVG